MQFLWQMGEFCHNLPQFATKYMYCFQMLYFSIIESDTYIFFTSEVKWIKLKKSQ